ncbi:P-loop containing nucleoside triphosphate hydrolase protein [Piedraia hortae CBS 480.64]|uniref:P-loop containing nucleoside triphosphate hydrolase protein n=1 Tax=Piedraia hortae CBS 480.64 TaxID=1314780 RepID=A0A6A7CB29_9PEZI|nr:P-loop containing nucleoside triphosphate hydrolase protein [Piedraia hortae CBS 480.64]
MGFIRVVLRRADPARHSLTRAAHCGVAGSIDVLVIAAWGNLPFPRKPISFLAFCTMARYKDDKVDQLTNFIIKQIGKHQQHRARLGWPPKPFIIGVNGVQGAGKSTLVSKLAHTLDTRYRYSTLVLSIDDLYLPHDAQVELAKAHPHNTLLQHRGQPGTHDVALGARILDAIERRERNVKIPRYDKSAFGGAGDRLPESRWETVNDHDTRLVDVVFLEGWCVGFRALCEVDLEAKWLEARKEFAEQGITYNGQLGRVDLNSLLQINRYLAKYDVLTDRLKTFIHLDARDTQYVYAWRKEQEASLRLTTGSGMTDNQVVQFVNGYYPAYELYLDNLRQGGVVRGCRNQITFTLGADRKAQHVRLI